jgi:hypothetical protein
MLRLLGTEILFVPVELPLLSICMLALVDAECLFCLCSGSVNNGYSPGTALSSLGSPISGCSSGTAITALSSCWTFFLACFARFEGKTLGVEFVGFHSRAALGRGHDPILLLPVPERLRNGDGNSGFPFPPRTLRRLQRVGVVTRTSGEVAAAGNDDGAGY